MQARPQKSAAWHQITSPQNSLVKVFRRALAEGVTREGWIAVEGPAILQDAVNSPGSATPQAVLASQSAAHKFRDLLAQVPPEAEVATVPDALFGEITSTETPQGVAALIERKQPELDAVLSRPEALLVVACGLQDPGNMGTIVRTAQALGASALAALRETVSPFNPKALRASAGAVLRLPIYTGLETRACLERLRRARVRLVAADRRSPSPLAQADLTGRVAFLVGREATGLPPEIAAAADMLLSIPIRPETDSLNAATAAGIFLYEAARQRGFRY